MIWRSQQELWKKGVRESHHHARHPEAPKDPSACTQRSSFLGSFLTSIACKPYREILRSAQDDVSCVTHHLSTSSWTSIQDLSVNQHYQTHSKGKLHGYALYSVLMVSVLIALFSTAFILLTFHYQGLERQAGFDRKLRNNAQSGINYVLAGNSIPKTISLDLFGEQSDTVVLSKKPWGVYQKIRSKAVHGNQFKSIEALAGGKIELSKKALVLSNSTKALGVCGNTVLNGDVTVPEKGIERAYIEGQSYTSSKLFYGEKFVSKSSVPELEVGLLTNLNAYFLESFEFDEEVGFEGLKTKNNSDTVFLAYEEDKIEIGDDIRIKAIVQSKTEIIVHANAKINGCILLAPIVRFESGFRGRVQVFANQEIFVAGGCELEFPSVMAIKSNSDRQAKIELKEEVQLYGVLLSLQDHFKLKNNNLVSIGKGSVIKGQVYAQGYLELKKTKVEGQVYTDRFWLKTNSSVYENVLLNVEIDPSKLDPRFSGLVFEENKKLQIIERY